MKVGLHDLAQSAATDGQIPAWDDASGLWVPVDPSGGGSDPTTTKGDLIVNDGSGLDRLPVGADGQILYADSGEALGVKWDDAPSGGGGGATDPLTPTSLHATYGDHFTGSSLDAKWTRVTYASGDETYQAGGGSWLQTAARTTGAYYYQAAPSGDFTLVMKTVWYAVVGNQMFGLICVDNNGAGVAGGWYNGSDDGPIVAHLNNGISYDGTNVGLQSPKNGPRGSVIGFTGMPCWYKLVRSGNTWKVALSLNGQAWSAYTSTITVSFTPTRIGFGNFQASTTTIPGGMLIDFFDVQ